MQERKRPEKKNVIFTVSW